MSRKTHRIIAGVSFLVFFGLAAMMENAGSMEQLLRLFLGSMAALLFFAWNASEGGLYDYDPWEGRRGLHPVPRCRMGRTEQGRPRPVRRAG